MHVYRRGFSFQIETSRRESPTLYGITRRAVASKGGEPGSRWHLQHYGSMPLRYHRASDDDTYLTTHLHYSGVQDTGRDDSSHPTYLHYEGREPREPSGYQHRSRGSLYTIQRATLCRCARAALPPMGGRQKNSPTGSQYHRIWKRSLQDSTLRVHGGLNPLPPIHPRPTYVERHYKNIKQASRYSLIHPINHSRSIQNSLTVPLPTSTHLRIMSWNVEGLKETAKYDSIIRFCSQHTKFLSCAQRKLK